MDLVAMSDTDRVKWDERYATGDYQPRAHPSPLVELAIRYVPPGRALVLACGSGRNALRLADAGFEVEAVDISSVAIDKARAEAARRGLDVEWRVADIGALELEAGLYDLITMVRYVNRDIWPRVVDALSANGWLLMVQHFRTRRVVRGPGDEFRLDPGELLQAFSGMRIVEYSETLEPVEGSDQMAATATLLACKGDPGW